MGQVEPIRRPDFCPRQPVVIAPYGENENEVSMLGAGLLAAGGGVGLMGGGAAALGGAALIGGWLTQLARQ